MKPVWISLALVVSAAGSMALEIVAGRLLAPYVGMSLYSWTAIISVVLAGLSAGHWAGGLIADRSRHLAPAAGLALMAAAATSLASLFVLRAAAGPVLAAFDPVSGIGVLALAAFFLPSFAAGLLSPVLTKMALEEAAPERRGRVLGTMFALGALGAILGTVAAGFWLIGQIGAHGSVLAVTAAYAAMALPFFGRWGRVAAGTAVGVAAVAAVFGPGRIDALTTPCDRESDYYCIRIDPVPGFGDTARIMVLDHLGHGINLRDAPESFYYAYLHLVDELVLHRLGGRAPEAFFVGGGGYTLPRAWAARWPEARPVVAEIDPEVTRVVREEMWVDTDRLEIVHGDGRTALAAAPPGRFDVIFGDAFQDIAIPAHLVTDEFHALVRSRLAPGGIYVMNVLEAMREPPFLLSLVRTLEARFPVVELWLDADEIGPVETRTTWIVVASDTDSGLTELTATRGFQRTWLRVPTDAMLRVIPEAEQVFLTDDFAPVDRLMSHILFDSRLAE